MKFGEEVCKAGIPNCGTGLMVNITRYDGAFWNVSGLKMPDEIHVTFNGGMLKVGDEIELEFAEFDEATPSVAEVSHKALLEAAATQVDDSPEIWTRKLDTYYRMKKILNE